MNFEQLKTIFWLRWRLTRNQWIRSQGVGAVIAALVAFAMVVLGVLSLAGGFLGGMFGLRAEKPVLVMATWFGATVAFLFLWLIGLMNEIQRSETIDLQRLMHLPVGLGQIFFVNYLASLLSMSIVIFVPGMVGLAVGLTVSHGAAMLLMVPLSLSMVFMVTALTYLLRGWLATLMANPRRRRAVIMGITFIFIMVSQAPNFYFNLMSRGRRESSSRQSQSKLQQLQAAQKFVPPFWVSVGAGALAEGRTLPALLGTFGCMAIGVAGLRRAYLGTLRFYHGDMGRKATAPIKADPAQAIVSKDPKAGARFLEFRLPAVPEQAAVLALATFRSMLRAPEVKMAWASSFVVTLIVAASFLLRGPPKAPEAIKPFVATGAVVFSTFLLVQFFSNQFGFDRDGFRALVLSPASRKWILLGKNIACLPAGVGFSVILLTLFAVCLRLSPLVVVAALFQMASLLLFAGLVGNLLSILVPYRIQPGSMKPTKMPGLAMLLMVLCHLFFPLAMLPIFFAPALELLWHQAGWPGLVPVNLVLSMLSAAVLGLVYWQALEPMGRLLQRRETKILAIVTVEVE